MVHALRECHRALRLGGRLIDLRPSERNRQVELELSGALLNIGEIDSSSAIGDDIAANDALRQALAAGLFRLEHDERLEYVLELDTLADLLEFGESLRRSVLPSEIVARIEALTAGERDFVIRVRRQMLIARYLRL